VDTHRLTEAHADTARARVLLALDVPDADAAQELVARVGDCIGGIKIGKELFTACGPDIVRTLGTRMPVFLDLKFHDIPNTVASAVRAAGRLGVRWLTLHVAGGAAMLEAAAQSRDSLSAEQRPLLLGVTVLTSTATNDPEEVVDRALLARTCGLDGAITSPLEVARLRQACGSDFLLVTPGVRPAGASRDDQRRVASPADAIRNGADYLVIGRPIRCAPDPRAAAASVVAEVASALRDRAPEASGKTRSAPPQTRRSRLENMLRDSGAFLEGHFVLTSGLHSKRYVQCAKLLQYPQYARRAGMWLAERLRTYEPHAVVSVALGGLVIGQETAAALGVRAVFAERNADGDLSLRRGFELEPGERVAIVDDVCTRGTSVAECEKLVRAAGALPVVAGAIIDRSAGQRDFALPFESLIPVEAIAVAPENCDACASGQQAVKPGSRRTTAPASGAPRAAQPDAPGSAHHH